MDTKDDLLKFPAHTLLFVCTDVICSKPRLQLSDSVWSLQKYAKLENGSWVQVDGNGDLDLIKQGLQLLVVHQGTGLDSITLNSNPHQLKGFWKGSTLAIAIKYKLTTRRIKFKFAATKNHSSVMNCGACVHMLKNYMHITDNTGTAKQETLQVTELYEYILKANSIERPLVPVSGIQADKSLDSLIKSCILDPGFPEFVEQVQSKLEEIQKISS
ncbi:uncharacterized protein LOC124796082 [Schistocerca piceifrons]|uniref:uncharacterized protein LOC124796082 n=1 Tax=Schistocerca piceifrons TaxID=274613 RepID=UPI001F5FEBED|nr:uncharacterized protein LOC124796082 [Schistocerca piceifrons]